MVRAPESSAEPESTSVREDEDGWVSDRSLPGDVHTLEGHQRTVMRHSSRANKKKRIERHRPSTHNHHHHRSRLSHPAPIDISASTESNTAPDAGPSTLAPDVPNPAVPGSPPSLPDTMDEEEPRGRTPATSTYSTVTARSSRRPRQHMRIVSLRGSEAASREVSPARSIRWADAGAGNSPATARWPQSPSASVQGSRAPSPGPPSTPGEPAEQDVR